MRDIALRLAPGTFTADVAVEANDLAGEDGYETAVRLSLELDRRDDDGPMEDRRGWWADSDRDRIGSRLWKLDRSKRTPETFRLAEAYARESLAWMVGDKVAQKIEVEAEFVERGWLVLTVTVHMPASAAAAGVRKYRVEVN